MLLFSLSSSNTFKGIALTFLMQDTASGFRRTSSSARLPRRTASTAHGFRRTASGARLPRRTASGALLPAHCFRRAASAGGGEVFRRRRRTASGAWPAPRHRRAASGAWLRRPGCCAGPAAAFPLWACRSRRARPGVGGGERGGGEGPPPAQCRPSSCLALAGSSAVCRR